MFYKTASSSKKEVVLMTIRFSQQTKTTLALRMQSAKIIRQAQKRLIAAPRVLIKPANNKVTAIIRFKPVQRVVPATIRVTNVRHSQQAAAQVATKPMVAIQHTAATTENATTRL
jgi:hypothetical protein